MKTGQPPTEDYLVTIDGVREVSLVGSADASFWRERLGKEGLFPYPGGEKVEIMLGADAIRWKGIDSLEFTFLVAVTEREEGGEKNYLLVLAFNSSPLFAWIERTFFQTPFSHSSIRLNERVPVNLGVTMRKGWYISAQMSAQARPVRPADELWEGSIHLPGDHILGIRRRFPARLGGRTFIYPFLKGSDSLYVNPASHRKVFNWLIESHFSPQEWKVRRDAVHSRSITIQNWKKSKPGLGLDF